MTQKQLKNRADIPEALTWDVTALYKTRADFEAALNGLKAATTQHSQ
jgi:oligoendopeptidase F